jgi:hypothetical protein
MGSLYFLKLLLQYHANSITHLFEIEHWNLLSTWILTLFSKNTDIVQVMIIFDRYI